MIVLWIRLHRATAYYPFLVGPTRPRWDVFFFFNDTATTEIYTLSLHDALPIYAWRGSDVPQVWERRRPFQGAAGLRRSEEHTSELQSPDHLVCRLLLEKKNNAHFV